MGVRKGNEEDKAAGESINSTRRRGEQCRTEQVAAATSIAAFTGFIAAVSERNSPHSFCILSSTVAQPLLQVAGYPLEQSSDGSSQHSAFTRSVALLNSLKVVHDISVGGHVAAATSIAAFTGFIAAVSERNSPHSFCILSSTVAQPLLQVAGYPLEQSSDGSSQHSAFTRPMALLNSTKLAQEPTTTGALPSSSSVCRSMAVPLMATTSSQCHPRAPARAHS